MMKAWIGMWHSLGTVKVQADKIPLYEPNTNYYVYET